jgi:hypothetical protein
LIRATSSIAAEQSTPDTVPKPTASIADMVVPVAQPTSIARIAAGPPAVAPAVYTRRRHYHHHYHRRAPPHDGGSDSSP